MARREQPKLPTFIILTAFLSLVIPVSVAQILTGQVLNPPYFNLAEGRKIYSSATCGEGVSEPELYCKLVGANTDRLDNPSINLIQGQVCDFCDSSDPKISHPPEYAIDGTQRWWQSPPLSRGNKYNEVNLTIDLGQEFHVAYVFIKMGNSPRPGVWILERSTDDGKTYQPWQYFADTPGDCIRYFGQESLQGIIRDDSVICETKFSKVVPLEGGEIVVSLLNDRPNADNFSYSPVLQEWTKATNVRLRLLRTKTLLGHLMSVARQDPTVTRRYFYSIKDINIGGRCVCNGHADSCDITDPVDPYKLLCRCQHNTCGAQCDECCPGFVQKKWKRAIAGSPFVCEPCNCFGHSDQCIYDEDVDKQRLSLDIHGHYEGGGVCLECYHYTSGINCNECEDGYYRPYGKLLNDTDVCHRCICDPSFSTGNCADGTGQCECRPEFKSPYCDECSPGYYGFPVCRPCDCNINGTVGSVCQVEGGQCPCKPNYSGTSCDRCAEGFFNFPECTSCECNPVGSLSPICDLEHGQCKCHNNFGGRECNRCDVGYYNYPDCEFCSCDPDGTTEEICENVTGRCLCRPGYGGLRCDQCLSGYFGYPQCKECNCDPQGSSTTVCDRTGRCRCLPNFSGLKCDQCSPGYYSYPDCLSCDCEPVGSSGISCNNDGNCVCKPNFAGERCDHCQDGFYNYPLCEECNCNPAGIVPTFGGCGSLTSGELCECKRHVTGRICHQCQPLYWNLKTSNPDGCEDCNCYGPGTLGGLGICDGITGKCMCKPSVVSRQCNECRDGTYQLEEDNLFGCHDCGCNIGGSVNNVCDKETGQCSCRPRINGRQCDKALQTHYFPILYQHQFEIEDGRTPANTQVRFGYDENVFHGYSWRGYAIFSDIQKEVLMDIYIEKPSLYQVIFHYLNLAGENVHGTITFTPEAFADIQQSSDMVFEATTQPRFMRVAGKQGLVAAPFVLNPGRWTVSVRIEKPLFLDYMVLLPQAYYEATLLQEDVNVPCQFGQTNGLCKQYRYPSISIDAAVVRGEAGYIAEDNQRKHTQLFTDEDVLEKLETTNMAWLNYEQTSLHMDLRVSKPGSYVFLILYHTREKGEKTNVMVELSTVDKMDKGIAVFYECNYSWLCRSVIVQADGQIAMFDLDSNSVNLIMTIDEDADVLIDSVIAIPSEVWHSDYVMPHSYCIRRDGKCLETMFPPVPEATKVEFESGLNVDRIAVNLPSTIFDKNTKLIYLNHSDALVDVHGTVPETGLYTIVVHYYQPDHPRFDMDVLIQNGQFYEGTLPLDHCPDSAGCRAVVKEKITDNISFQILESFVLTLKEPNHKSVWVDYALAIPSSQYDEDLLHPLPQDKAGKFIKECGQNNFYITKDSEEMAHRFEMPPYPLKKAYCQDAAFALTSEYNNGALPCGCDTDGSLSYECNEFGGQCVCRHNVIGRKCSRCQTGYFGFPNCKPCGCPSTAVCHPTTGQCICPPRVTGEKCDTCVPQTYGFDAIIGCEECNCSPYGVNRGHLQCDQNTGQCDCKTNVVGRQCDKCQFGYWSFPVCHLCSCDSRGTTEEICDQDTSRCYCKENVYGDSCDQCKPGTFYLEEHNPVGCSKCFCFGTTDRCESAYSFFIQVADMVGWDGVALTIDNHLNEVDMEFEIEEDITSISVQLPDLSTGTLFYFSAPSSYLGNKITSYGGNLYYTLMTTIHHDVSVGSIVGPDVILMGNNLTIVHDHLEQPAGEQPFTFTVNILEREFRHLTGGDVSREQMMMVLVNLEAILLRGLYFQPSAEIKLSDVFLDVTSSHYVADAAKALQVEQCQCPSNYQGTSCEECAPGYYRSKTGPYLGFCVPCQCNGHADTCDVNTGKCFNCQHNTVGDHCEKCAAGYHGNATQKTPYDCLICACPLPIETNNFAISCEVSPSGLEISCNCKPGYYGPRCESCAAGYFGRPEVPGSMCRRCQCSGNIDSENPGSCDSITGRCILCLNNTFGSACELCAPGYYGDAISKKDCKQCDCDNCGTERCDHSTGECRCHQNVVGYECDRCAADHWGFKSCRGCLPCDCGLASAYSQCDMETGQCECKPGAGGITCGICEPGYWLYSKDGCISCNCDEKYSAGAVCNPTTGLCQCLPGVIGDKCDSCPARWAFVEKVGCHVCGPCVHALLDDTDYLRAIIDPVWEEMTDISASYFAYQRLNNVNKTVDQLWPEVESLVFDPSDVNLRPLQLDVKDLEDWAEKLDQDSDHDIDNGKRIAIDADDVRKMALEIEKLVHDAALETRDVIKELQELAEGLLGTIGPNTDRLIAEAERILNELQSKDFSPESNSAEDEKEKAEELLEQVKNFQMPSLLNKDALDELKKKLEALRNFVKNYTDNIGSARDIVDSYWQLKDELEKIPTLEIVKRVEDLVGFINKTIGNAQNILGDAKKLLVDADGLFKHLDGKILLLEQAINDLKDHLELLEDDDLDSLVSEAKLHANELMEQAALLDALLADTRNSSEGALKAATAYTKIVDAINNASIAANDALKAGNQSGLLSEGIADRAKKSEIRSIELLHQAQDLHGNVTEDLRPVLDLAKERVALIGQKNEKNSRDLDIINKELEKLQFPLLEAVAEKAANSSTDAENKAIQAKDTIQDILNMLPEDRKKAGELPENIEDAKDAIKVADSYVDKVATIVPDVNDLMEKVGRKGKALRVLGKDVSDKIAELRRKVAVAQTHANVIKLGVSFFGNTTLQLRNPARLDQAATFTHMSLYFYTNQSDGFLVYVGNEKGTHVRMKRTLTDDFMSLEVRGQRLVLTMDMGSGTERIVSQDFITIGEWHQAIIERTGKSVTLTVRAQGIRDAVQSALLSGTQRVFNLDQQLSKVYVGGIPRNAEIQPGIFTRPLIGCIEELEFGKTLVGLWNFIRAENNFEGCIDRTGPAATTPSEGLRFDGTGYAIFDIGRHNFDEEVIVSMEFKTFASEGLLFLIGNEETFLSLELQGGLIMFKYDFGIGITTLHFNKTLNDGNFHLIEATRFLKEGVLKVDGIEVDNEIASGELSRLFTTNNIYIGGYPGNHKYFDVTNEDFEGCIRTVQIGTQITKLLSFREAEGIVPGCLPSIGRTVSFSRKKAGYLAMPSANLEQIAQLTFKFKTKEGDGILFYAANDDQSNYVSVSLSNGALVLRSEPGDEIRTRSDIHYNDTDWHYATVTREYEKLLLDIDDVDTLEQEITDDSLTITTPFYFGGVPNDYRIDIDAVPTVNNFVGCLGDILVNDVFQDFAVTAEKQGASLSKCPLVHHPSTPPPAISPVPLPDTTTVEPEPEDQCKLPLHPHPDPDIKPEDGLRFGNTPWSRQEYSLRGFNLLEASIFSLDFNTRFSNGVLLYMAGKGHIDFEALYMQDGKLNYAFNCGSGAALITSTNTYNDSTWHNVIFSRIGKEGILTINNSESITGESVKGTTSMNVKDPLYIGGLSETTARVAKANLKDVTGPFPGCIRNVKVNNEKVTKRISSVNVTSCSKKVEDGTFISAEGGYVILYDKFNVGQEIDIDMQIKPRNPSGVLIAVHGSKDYLVLELTNERLQLTVDNGAGAGTTYVNVSSPNSLCDGKWHKISFLKAKNYLYLALDDKGSQHTLSGRVTSTDTNSPLYIGGIPDPASIKGVQVTEQYVGCIKSLVISTTPQSLNQGRIFGHVTLNTCPTI